MCIFTLFRFASVITNLIFLIPKIKAFDFSLITGVTRTYKGIFIPLNVIIIGVSSNHLSHHYSHQDLFLLLAAITLIFAQVSLIFTFFFMSCDTFKYANKKVYKLSQYLFIANRFFWCGSTWIITRKTWCWLNSNYWKSLSGQLPLLIISCFFSLPCSIMVAVEALVILKNMLFSLMAFFNPCFPSIFRTYCSFLPTSTRCHVSFCFPLHTVFGLTWWHSNSIIWLISWFKYNPLFFFTSFVFN